MAEPHIVPRDFIIDDVGKHVKATKRRFIWKFSINSNSYELACDISIVSGKIKLTVNDRVLQNSQLISGFIFQHSFVLDGCNCIVLQQGDNIEFRINNKAFLHLLNQEKTKREFKHCEDEKLRDFVYDSSSLDEQKKMKLKIGAMSGMKKKKSQVESENWKQMGGMQSSIPNYFQPSHPPKEEQIQNSQVPLPQQKPILQEDLTTSLGVNLLSDQSQPVPLNNMPTIPEKAEQKSAMNLMEDFNTMQKMFATQMYGVCNNGSEQSVTTSQQNPPPQFNTMQSLFATQNPAQNNNQSKICEDQSKEGQFNTMQGLFKTQYMQCPPQPTQQVPENTNIQNIDLSNFNTMQQMFATVNPQQNISQMKKPENIAIDENNFNTMQNMFQTIQMSQMPKVEQGQSVHEPKMPDPNEYSTMQNLFATQKLDLSQMQKLEGSQMQGLETLNEIGNVNAINLNDFSTMQNLFKTNAHVEKGEGGTKQNSML